MSRQYSNIKTYLEVYGYILDSSLEDVTESKKVIFRCKYNHSTTLTFNSYMNKKAKNKTTPEKLCTECEKSTSKESQFLLEKNIILEQCGHTLISLKDRENAVYICGNCEKENKTWLTNLHSNKGCCPSCQNQKFKNKEEDVVERIDKFGVTLINYEDCHNIQVVCKCGEEFDTSLSDIERGRLCIKCKGSRTKETNVKLYGHENTFQVPEFKEKMKETCLVKYGETHHMKNKEILNKAKQTNKERYGCEFVFHTIEAVRKGRETMVAKYGVEFPLQSEFIIAKVRQTFLDTIGYEYPLLCPEIREFCIIESKKTLTEKYGVDSYFKTEIFKKFMDDNRIIIQEKVKKTLMDRYGVDSYFKTDEFISNYPIYWQRSRETCLDKYGVEFPIQNPEIYSKCIKSLFSKNEYTFPSGRKSFVRGYEPQCIDILLKDYSEDEIIVETIDIPVIKYQKTKNGKDQDAVYYPDVLLPTKLIEVKSTYTYNRDPENNERKFKECVVQGFDIELWMFNGKKELMWIRSYTKEFPNGKITLNNEISESKIVPVKTKVIKKKVIKKKVIKKIKKIEIVFESEDDE